MRYSIHEQFDGGPIVEDETGRAVIRAETFADSARIVADADELEKIVGAANGWEEVESLIGALRKIRDFRKDDPLPDMDADSLAAIAAKALEPIDGAVKIRTLYD